MNKKPIVILIIILSCFITLAAAAQAEGPSGAKEALPDHVAAAEGKDKSQDTQGQKESGHVLAAELNMRKLPSEWRPSGLTDRKIVLEAFGDKGMIYKTFDRVNKTEREAGRIEPFYIGGDQVMMKDSLYFYASTLKNGRQASLLFELDSKNNRLTPRTPNHGTNLVVPIAPLGDQVLSVHFKRDKRTGIGETKLQMYDTMSKTEKTALTRTVNTNTKQGVALLDLDVYDNKIYVVVDEGDANGKVHKKIEVYDKEVNLVDTISLNDFNKSNGMFLDEMINEFKIFGDYLFLSNAANDGVIGKMTGKGIETLMRDKPLSLPAAGNLTNPYLFFKNTTNTYYLLDIASGQLKSKNIEFVNGMQPQYLIADANTLILELISAEGATSLYQLDLNRLRGIF